MSQEMTTPARQPTRLLRDLGVWDLAAIGINGVIGGGIFILPATVAQLLGTAAPLAYLLAATVVSLVALCFAVAGSYFTTAGGPYLYAHKAFGPFVGFQVGWVTWLVRATSLGALSSGLATYLGYFWSAAALRWQKQAIITAVFACLVVVNVWGVRSGARVVNLLTLVKLLPLTLFVGVGAFAVDLHRVLPIQEVSLQRLGESALLLIFAFGGFEILVIPAEEMVNPRRDVPRSLLATMMVVTLVYASIQWVAAGTFSALAGAPAPLASAAAQFMGPFGGTLMTVGAVCSITGTMSGLMLAGPRVTYALAQNQQLPSWFGAVHPRFRTPYLSILFLGGVSLALALSGTFVQLAGLAAIARLLQYIATCLALVKLHKEMDLGPARFKLPGRHTVPVLAVILCAGLLLQSKADQVYLTAAALGIGAGLFWLAGRVREQEPTEPRPSAI
jgi:basic amino acid/polyamine antiporter, APA family